MDSHSQHHSSIGQNGLHLREPQELDGGEDEEEDEPIEMEEDEAKPAERTSVIEQCLAYGSEQRLRLQLTLSVTGAPPLMRSCKGQADALGSARKGLHYER